MLTTDGLKVGDKVGVVGGGWGDTCVIRTVAKRTATQVVLDDGTRWTRRGYKVGSGGSYYREFLVDERDAIQRAADYEARTKRSKLIQMVRDLDLKQIANEGLTAMLQAADDHKLP